jgi:hypothetical protein
MSTALDALCLSPGRMAPGLVVIALLLAACSEKVEPPPVADAWQAVAGDGSLLEQPEGDHHCVFDRRTGLMWEVKQAEAGPHRPDATWSWYLPDSQRNMSDAGQVDGGECDLERCDTHTLVTTINDNGLCGFHDWQLPEREQLMTLGDRRLADQGRIMDPRFFPRDPVGEYWTSSTFRLYPQSAWVVDSRHGLDRAELKTEARYARLVRRHAEPEQGDR